MGKLFDKHDGWTREDLDESFGPHPYHTSAPTRKELEMELAADLETPTVVEDPWAAFDSLAAEEEAPDRYGEDDLRQPWTTLSDEEIRVAVRRICQASKSDREVQDRLRDELGYPYGDAAIASTSDGRSRMTMVMLHGPHGTISI